MLAALYLPGPYSSAAESLLISDPDWAAPIPWRSEFRNVLAGYLRRGTPSFDQVLRRQEEAESLLSGAEFEVDSAQVLQHVRDSDCSACDCEFIALATTLRTTLVTLDRKLLRSFPQRAIALGAG